MQHALRFLEAVMPAGGYRVVASKPPQWTKGLKHTFLKTNEEVVQYTARLDAAGVMNYFALASYESPDAGRTAANTVALQCLWLDVDYKQYASPEEAQDDAARLYALVGAPSIRVQSGGGLHAYWVLRGEVATHQWKPLAEAFQATWQALGIKADAISADAARILRLPGSHNFKYDPAPEVTVESFEDISYDAASLARKLNAVEAPPRPAPLPDRVDVPDALNLDNDDLVAGMGLRESHLKPMVDQCAQLKWAYAHQHETPEPVWYAVIQLVRHTVEGVKAAHIFSIRHPNYSREETDAKLAQLERNEVKPTTCEHFKRVNPGPCAGCTLSVNSPISLGFEVAAPAQAPILEMTPTGEVQEVVDPEDDPMPTDYQKAGGRMYRTTHSEEGSNTFEIFRGFMAVRGVLTNPRLNYQTDLLMWVRSMGQPGRHITIPGKTLADKRDISKEMSGKGIVVMSKNAGHILDMLQEMTQGLQTRQRDFVTAEQMGWQSDGTFIVGTTAYQGGSKFVADIPLTAGVKQSAAAYVPAGSFDKWRAMAEIYNRPGAEAYQFALCYGAAGVFLDETRLSGAVLSLVSQSPGRGKSTAGEAALSWWGNPDVMKSQTKDTVNAIFAKASRHKNLPILMDEVTTKPAWELEDLVYFMSQGREKERLTSDATPRPILPGWALPVISTSNNSIRAKLLSHRGDAQALFARVMEVSMDLPFAETMGFTDRAALKTGFKQNYGHAGPALAQYAITHRDEWVAIMDALAAKFDAAVNGDAGFRFWVASCAATLTVAVVGSRLGIVKYDTDRLTSWAVGMLKAQRQENSSSISDSDDILSRFLEQNANRIIVAYNRMAGNVQVPSIWPEDGVRGTQLVGRAEIPERSLYISQAAFSQFCQDSGFDLPSFIRQATAVTDPSGEPLLKSAAPKSVNLGRGTKTAAARARSLEFNLLHPSLKEYAIGIDTRIAEATHLRSVK